jgi:hypothetical protein
VALCMLPNLGYYRLESAVKIVKQTGLTNRWRGHGSVVQLVTGFFAMAGLVSLDWGARVLRRRDVLLGGLTGIVLAGSWTAIMSLLVITGAVAQFGGLDPRWWSDEPFCLSFRWAVYHGIGGIPGGVILILFGLATLAPACYSAWVYGQKLSTHWPCLGQSGWTWIGGAITFVLGATSYSGRLEWIFTAMGAVFAPAIGAITGDWLRHRGAWVGIRPGVNRTGIIAWATGLAVAFELEVDRAYNPGTSTWWQSTSVCGFVCSVVVSCVWATLVRDRPVAPVSRHVIGQ